MPCEKCKDENYKWGKTGSCKYKTKEDCEKANPKNYNKMRPTPIGKKSYEEYEKELKEYNLSVEPKLEKVELGLADDLKKFNSEVDKITEDVNKDSNDLSKLFQELRNLADDFNKINDRRRDSVKKGKSTLKELNTLLEKTQTQAKELGIAPKDIPNFSKNSKMSADLRASVNDIQKYSYIKI